MSEENKLDRLTQITVKSLEGIKNSLEGLVETLRMPGVIEESSVRKLEDNNKELEKIVLLFEKLSTERLKNKTK